MFKKCHAFHYEQWFEAFSIIISRFLKHTRACSLFTSAATNQMGVFQKGGQEKLRSDFQRARGDRVAVSFRWGGIGVFEEMIF